MAASDRAADAVVVGAGIVGAACAEALTAAGLTVVVVDRGAAASGTTGRGEGNVLVSDKPPGPELELIRASREQWPLLLARIDATDRVEWEEKGGLVVAMTSAGAEELARQSDAHRAAGVEVRPLSPAEAHTAEPYLTPRIEFALYYAQDAQVQPVLATTALLAAVRRRGGTVRSGVTVRGVRRARDGSVRAVATDDGEVACPTVINAAGPWSGEVAQFAGVALPVEPRHGLILVTGPLPQFVRHKVYDADYVAAVESGAAALRVSAVVESTAGGTVLIGSSRQRVGFTDRIDPTILARLAQRAGRLFPRLRGVPIMRAYGGLRPYLPDHLPVIGPDPRVPGLWHATGHEGAGIGLAPATGRLLTELLTGTRPHVDPRPFRVDRPGLQAVA
jgi:D-hydroxyproline dehydrogenase subunit beta